MVAKMITEVKTYIEISEVTGDSNATKSRVNRSLEYGNDGYSIAMERIESETIKE